jgi:MFS transporter, AAHS family, 4-hydroxybenzoate transporter
MALNVRMTLASAIDISHLVDNRPIDRWLIGLTALCALVLVFDGYDTQAIGYVAPALAKEFNATKSSLGPIFSAGLLGLLLGSLICGPAADRFGRRTVMIAATSWFALCAGITPLAPSLDHLFVLRLLTGLGLGGALPNAMALVGEYAPKRCRATMITLTVCGFPIGAAIGGALASWIVPHLGWRTVFYIGGAGPLLVLPALWLKLPESLRILVIRRNCDTQIAAILARMGHPTIAAHRLVSQDRELGFALVHLFQDRRAVPTLLLWTAFFMNLVTIYFLTNWMPIITNGAGVSVSEAVLITAMFQVGGTVGAIALGRLIDWLSAHGVLGASFFGAALLIAAMGIAGNSFAVLAMLSFGAGFCVVGSQIGANALASTFYPAAAHATGIGWALGIGRLGAIAGPLLGGLIVARNWSTATVFVLGAIPSICAAIAILAMGLVWAAQGPGSPSRSSALTD